MEPWNGPDGAPSAVSAPDPELHVYVVTVEVLVDAKDEEDAELEALDLLALMPATCEIVGAQQRSAK